MDFGGLLGALFLYAVAFGLANLHIRTKDHRDKSRAHRTRDVLFILVVGFFIYGSRLLYEAIGAWPSIITGASIWIPIVWWVSKNNNRSNQ